MALFKGKKKQVEEEIKETEASLKARYNLPSSVDDNIKEVKVIMPKKGAVKSA